MKNVKMIRTTTFQLPHALLTQLRMMAILTETSQGEFIRIAIRDKIEEIKRAKSVHSK